MVHSTELVQDLTQHSEVQLTFPVASWEGSKLTDVNSLILQLQPRELNGAVFEGRIPKSHPLFVWREDGDPHGGVVDGHILLGAVGGFLPRDLRDLDIRERVGEAAVQDHICPDKPRHCVID